MIAHPVRWLEGFGTTRPRRLVAKTRARIDMQQGARWLVELTVKCDNYIFGLNCRQYHGKTRAPSTMHRGIPHRWCWNSRLSRSRLQRGFSRIGTEQLGKEVGYGDSNKQKGKKERVEAIRALEFPCYYHHIEKEWWNSTSSTLFKTRKLCAGQVWCSSSAGQVWQIGKSV